MDKKQFCLNLPKEIYDRIRILAEKDRRSVTQEILIAIEFWIDNRVDIEFTQNK